MAIFEAYFIINLVYEYTIKDESELIAYISLFATIIAMAFLYRKGYVTTITKLKLNKLKSVVEHLTILWEGLQDLLSVIFTLGVIV